MGLEAAEQLSSLPNFAQALVAVRMVHRAVLAKYPEKDAERELIESALAAAVECIRAGDGTSVHKPLFDRAMKLRNRADGHRTGREHVRAGVFSAIDSVNAASAAVDFPVDAVVTGSAERAIAALCQDRELSGTQIVILAAADVDLLLFACGEENKLPARNIGAKYDGLGDHLLGRLTALHPLTVVPSVRTAKEAAR